MRVRSWRRAISKIAFACLAASLPVGHTGCAGALAQVLYMVNGGHKLPAKYDGLEDQRVALVVRSLDAMSGASPECDLMADRLTLFLKREVDDIEFAPRSEVESWIERGDGTQEYVDIGAAVDADKVLVVEMSNYALNEDATLFKGRADIDVIVFDVKSKEEVFRQEMFDFAYPKNSGQPCTETTATRFELKFLTFTAGKISRLFYAYNIEEDFGEDATSLWD
ncbi:MAG TPA: hypothetical protein VGN57_13360 [Pirellulaceae bacterium]|jgi:hypothetical protein|nr:hypothetical protein [Pirellulaceae bacterium]